MFTSFRYISSMTPENVISDVDAVGISKTNLSIFLILRFYRRIIFICVYNIPIATLFNIWVCEVYFITIVDKQTECVPGRGLFH